MPNSAPTLLQPLLTPQGHLRLVANTEADSAPLPAELNERLAAAFAAGAGHGLLQLGAAEVGTAMPPSFAWWRDFAARYITALCATPEGEDFDIPAPIDASLEALIADSPPMSGAEYLTPAVLAALWGELDQAFRTELAHSARTLPDFLKALHPAWNLVGRVHFHLAENRKDADFPFAFLATYTSRLSAHGKAQHQPLTQALAEFSGGR